MQGSLFTIVAIALLNTVQISFSSNKDIRSTHKRTVQLLSHVFKSHNKHFNQNNSANDSMDKKLINKTIRQVPEKMHSTSEVSKNDSVLVQKRTEPTAMPWICDSREEWTDLGYSNFPRFVKEVICNGTSCVHGFYTCKQRLYKIKVLSERLNGGEIDFSLPRNLRQSWKFMDIDISVGCYCGN